MVCTYVIVLRTLILNALLRQLLHLRVTYVLVCKMRFYAKSRGQRGKKARAKYWKTNGL